MDLNSYWIERGKTYQSEERLNGQFYRDQEQLFLTVVQTLAPVRSVIDVGCGFGRITKVLAEAMPRTMFHGVDISQDQLRGAEKYCAGLSNVLFSEHDLLSHAPMTLGYDLATCCEVLLHIPNDQVAGVIVKILNSAKHLVHEVDPNCKKTDPLASHCFFHDYEELYSRMGLSFRSIGLKGQVVMVVSR